MKHFTFSLLLALSLCAMPFQGFCGPAETEIPIAMVSTDRDGFLPPTPKGDLDCAMLFLSGLAVSGGGVIMVLKGIHEETLVFKTLEIVIGGSFLVAGGTMVVVALGPEALADDEFIEEEHMLWLMNGYDTTLYALKQSPDNLILKENYLHTALIVAKHNKHFILDNKIVFEDSKARHDLLSKITDDISDLEDQSRKTRETLSSITDNDRDLLILDAQKIRAQMKEDKIEEKIIEKNQAFLKKI